MNQDQLHERLQKHLQGLDSILKGLADSEKLPAGKRTREHLRGLMNLTANLKQDLKQLDKNIEQGESEELVAAKETPQKELGERSGKVEGEQPLSDFFTSLGKGLVETQRLLDRESKNYLRGIRDQPYILPSVFRVPKLSGELKVGMEMREDKKVNLIVASRKEVATNLREQTIQFEITAAPPPPDALARIQSLIPNFSLVLAPGDRETIHGRVRGCLSGQKGVFSGTAPNPAEALNHAVSALRIAAPSEPPDHDKEEGILIVADEDRGIFLLAAFYQSVGASGEADDLIGLWELVPQSEKTDPVLTQIWKLSGRVKPGDYKRMTEILAGIVDRQRQFFRPLRPGGS